ncbi:MAG: Asparagine synthetase [glutamine-hydrolyzing] [Nitrospira sp.]|jgi:asparagine synthase (glutamine-hydrolysing)|nr:MAG: Asparagine synthetase [glutamine-hydrolyzing] [Nitrospira sp.]
MCGIAGFIGTRYIADPSVQTCLDLMRHRGPDASGVRRFTTPSGRHVLLMHSRLSIIDLDPRSNQPFKVDRRWMVLNGELYNYLEIKERLVKEGVRFQTRSDTEVFLAAICRDGWRVLDQAEGMWAVAVYDEDQGDLTLSRDRFGEKPLYVVRSPEGLYFGSEAKFLFALMGRTLPVNLEHVRRYLVNGYKAIYKSHERFFERLEEVSPAGVLRIGTDGNETEALYWEPAYRPENRMTYEEAVSGVRARIVRSMELRLRSDVPAAFLMSGGVDSNVLIGIAKRVFGYDVHGFTILIEDERYDERDMLDRSVAELGVRHTALNIDPADYLDNMTRLIRYHDGPVSTISHYVQWLLMRDIHAQGYKICFSGVGADELVSGYYDHYLMHLAEIRHEPEYASTRAAWQQYVQPFVRNPYLSDPDLFVNTPGFRDHIFLNNDEFADYLTQPFSESFTERRYSDSLLRNRMMNEMFIEATRVILHETDLNAMYFSIENRSPYLDRDLFEFCYSIPNRYLSRNGYNKVVLRDAARGFAPDCVLNERRKVGFNAPVHAFLDVDDPAVAAWLTAESPVFELLKRNKLVELLRKPRLANSESKFLFYFVNAKVFLEEFAA